MTTTSTIDIITKIRSLETRISALCEEREDLLTTLSIAIDEEEKTIALEISRKRRLVESVPNFNKRQRVRVFNKGDTVTYTGTDGNNQRVIITEVHKDDIEVYYTILTLLGREKQTIGNRLTKEP
jgi:regulator of replication initiation timing